MRARAALLLGLGLTVSGCSGGGSLPPPSPPPPGPVAHPGKELVMEANWGVPLSAAGTCGGSPFACHLPPGTQWGLQQQGDVQFVETQGGLLTFRLDPPGMSMVSATVLDHTQPMSMEAEVRVDSLDCSLVSYTGLVIYSGGVDDGDPSGNYGAEYISCFPGDPGPKLWIYTPQRAEALPIPVGLGQWHTLRLDWVPGQARGWWLDGQLVFQEPPDWSPSGLGLGHDPHPSLWFGAATGVYGRVRAWGTPSASAAP